MSPGTHSGHVRRSRDDGPRIAYRDIAGTDFRTETWRTCARARLCQAQQGEGGGGGAVESEVTTTAGPGPVVSDTTAISETTPFHCYILNFEAVTLSQVGSWALFTVDLHRNHQTDN